MTTPIYLVYQRYAYADKQKIASFVDDTCIIMTGKKKVEPFNRMQTSINQMVEWAQRRCVTLNETKSIHVKYSNKSVRYILLYNIFEMK